MKFIRTFALLAGVTLLFTACGKESDELNLVEESSNPLLAYVPTDTTYVFATMEPVPAGITDAYVQRFQPALDVMSNMINQFQTDYAAGEYEGHEQARFAKAVLAELGGELNPQSLEKLGISMQAQHAVYGMGLFPVIRVELSDAEALRAAIERIEAELGFDIPEQNLNGTDYWAITETGAPVGAYLAILDGQFVFSLFPVSAEDSMLGALLGHEMPAQSMASDNTLALMNKQKGYTAYGSGVLDLQKLANELLDPNSTTNAYLGQYHAFSSNTLDEVCVAEIKSMVDKAPRMTAGTTRLDANEISMRYDLELENTLAGSLLELVSDVAPAAEGDHLFSASLALKVGKARSFLLEKASAMATTPYQCEELQDMNRQASEMAAQLNIPMPPMVNNLLGLRVRLDEVDLQTGTPTGKGVLALHVDKPEMFVGMATMMLPGFDALDLANQSEPVRIPSELIRMEGLEVFALIGEESIGLSVGDQYADELEQFLTTESRDNSTLFSVSYDMARQMELQQALSGKLNFDMHYDDSHSHEFTEALRASYIDMLDRSSVEVSFSAGGMTIDSRISFK